MNIKRFLTIITVVLLSGRCYAHDSLLAQEAEIAAKEDENSLESLLDTKISTAAKYEQSIQEAPASVSIISSEEIGRHGYRTLAEALNSLRGFYLRNDRNYDYVGARGFENPNSYNNKIQLQLNGHIINDNIYGSPFFGNDFSLPMSAVERIEVIRGPGSALYGGGAMLCVINVITKAHHQLENVQIGLRAGSFGAYDASVTAAHSITDDIGYTFSGRIGYTKGQDLYFPEFDSPETNNGKSIGNDWERSKGFFFSMQAYDFKINAFFSSKQKGIPTGCWGMTFNDGRAQLEDIRHTFDLEYNKQIRDNFELKARVYGDYYHYNDRLPYDTVFFQADTILGSALTEKNTGQWYGAEIQSTWDITSNNRLISGIEYKYSTRADYVYESEKGVYFNQNFPYGVFSAYVQDHFQPTELLSLTFGLRFDKYSHDFTDTTHSPFPQDGTSFNGSAITPRVAVIFYPTKPLALKFLYGSAYRPANIYEMYYRDFKTTKSNPSLKPEYSDTYEIVAEYSLTENILLTLSGYYYEIRDIITQINDHRDTMAVFRNQDKGIGKGIECEFNSRFESGLWLNANYSYQVVTNSRTNQEFSNSPEHLFKISASQTFFDDITAGVEFAWESSRRSEASEWVFTKTNAFSLTNIFVKYEPNFSADNLFVSALNKLRFSVKVFNVFDNDYYYPTAIDFTQSVMKMDGRKIMFELGIQF